MWCPSVSLAVWANAWIAGKAAPDDVLDALSLWAPTHSVTAYDAVAASATGLPWPDVNDAGAVSMLQTLRTAAGVRSIPQPSLSIVLPVPGDVRGLPAGTTFARDALDAGEAVIVTSERGTPVGLVPDFEYEASDDAFDFGSEDDDYDDSPELRRLAWTVYSLPTVPVAQYFDLGEAEFELRSAVRSAAEALSALRAGGAGVEVEDPRGMVEQVLESGRHHIAPEHAPTRALRVLDNAAHVDAIITVSAGLMPISTQSSSEVQIASDALRPLGQVVRSARLAAVTAILHSAWES
ncbi:hypothetical protein BVC93_28260 [Mycobacterium sp. MS1601]|uniref:hypothetical protein n=1 Tax=Mycobacterium sp. MS1601 TaxID=1936029 RepID=UPI000979609A|nr:hypothetical protein [Mycobacterium sp. MS1601]AQA06800.1 hypothetical protein BVC93_28260 [Mycobacterium sp. MS1601]